MPSRAARAAGDSYRIAGGLRPRNSRQVRELQFTKATARGSVRRPANPLCGGGTGRPPASICWPFRRTPRPGQVVCLPARRIQPSRRCLPDGQRTIPYVG